MKNYLKSIAIGALLAVTAAPVAEAQTIKREFRSTWISTVWGLDWPSTTAKGGAGTGTTTSIIKAQKQFLCNYLDKMKAANMTGVCFQVRARADAFYPSKYAPWSSDVSGSRGTNPGWDPLAYAIEEAHKRGLELYAWINPYRWSTAGDWSTTLDKQWVNNGWIITHTSTDANGKTTTLKYLNPGIKGVHDLIVNVVDEIVSGYAVDGLIIDDYFYPNGISKGSDASDYQTWKNSGTSLSIGDWRRENVNTLVADIQKKIMSVKPDVRFGIGPPGIAGASASKYGLPSTTSYGISSGDWQYDGQYTDPLQWMFSGNIDFISPQIYWRTDNTKAPYGPITKWWSNAAKKAGRHHYASLSISALGSNNTESYWKEYCTEIQLNRDYSQDGAPGYCLFRTAFISGPTATGLGDYIVANKSTGKVLQPEVTWKDSYRHSYAAPTGGAKSGATLSWDAVTDGNRMIRYSVYAVPSKLTIDKAQSADGDGIKADYLLGVSYTNSFTLPSSHTSDYWYAVCVYDGFSHEHPAAYINYKITDNAPATTLLTPADGTKHDGEILLSWKKVDTESYTIEISSDKSFSTIVKTISDITSTSYRLGSGELTKGTFYWRVISNKTGANPGRSEAWSFTVTSVPTGTYEPGYTIQTEGVGYSDYGVFKFQNLWVRSTGLGNFTQQSDGALNRGFAVREDGVFISGRSANSSSADLYLAQYDPITGEHIRDIKLNGGQCGYYPCNDVTKDSHGNLIITNLSLNIATTPLCIYKVNTDNGNVWCHAELTYSGTGRVDHAAVVGDVTGDFLVFAALAGTKTVVRWTVSAGGNVKATETCTLGDFYPSTSSNLGTAPNITPIDNDRFYVNGASTAMTPYTFKAGQTVRADDSFANLADEEDQPGSTHNGGSILEHRGLYLMVSPRHGHDGPQGYQWDIFTTNSTYDYSEAHRLYRIPTNGLGTVNNKTFQAQTDYYIDNSQESPAAYIYTYAPGNGIAGYKLYSPLPTVVVEPVIDSSMEVNVLGRQICLSDVAESIRLYTPAGVLVAEARNEGGMYCDVAPGLYILRVSARGYLTTTKVVIR